MTKYLLHLILLILLSISKVNIANSNEIESVSIYNCTKEKSQNFNYDLIINNFKETSKLWEKSKNYRWLANDLFLIQFCFEYIDKKDEYKKILEDTLSNTLNYKNIKDYKIKDKNEHLKFLSDLDLLVGTYAVHLFYEDNSKYHMVNDQKGWEKLKNILYISKYLDNYENIYTYSQVLVKKNIKEKKIINEYKYFLDNLTIKKSNKEIDSLFLKASKLEFYNAVDRQKCFNILFDPIFIKFDYKNLNFDKTDLSKYYKELKKYRIYKDYLLISTDCGSFNLDEYSNFSKNRLDFLQFAKNNYLEIDENLHSDYLSWHTRVLGMSIANGNKEWSKYLYKTFFKEFKLGENNLSFLDQSSLLIGFYSKLQEKDVGTDLIDLNKIYNKYNKTTYENYKKFYTLVASVENFNLEKERVLVQIYILEGQILFNQGRLNESIKANLKAKEILESHVFKNPYNVAEPLDSFEANLLMATYNRLIDYYSSGNNNKKILPVIKEANIVCKKMIDLNSKNVLLCADLILKYAYKLNYYNLNQFSLDERYEVYKNFNIIFTKHTSNINQLTSDKSNINVLFKKLFYKGNSLILGAIWNKDKSYLIEKGNKKIKVLDLMCDYSYENLQLVNKYKDQFTADEILGLGMSNLGCLSEKGEKTIIIEKQLINYLLDYKNKVINDFKPSLISYLNYRNVDSTLITALATADLVNSFDGVSKNGKKKINDINKELFELLHTQYGLSNFAAKKNYLLNKLNKEDKKKFIDILDLNRKKNQIDKQIVNQTFETSYKFNKERNIIENKIKLISKSLDSKIPKLKLIKIEKVQKKLKDNEAIITLNWTTGFFNSTIITKNKFKIVSKNVPKLNEALQILRNKTKVENHKDLINDAYKIFGERLLNETFKILNNKKDTKITKLFFITDENISNFPIESLIVKNGKKFKHIIEIYSSSYYPSLQSFLNKKDNTINISTQNSYLGVGNPKFTSGRKKNEIISFTRGGFLKDSRKISFNFDELPYTKKEIDKVSLLFENSDKLLGVDANEEKIKDYLKKNYEVIQFATHAEVAGNFDNFNEPFLVLTPPKISNKKNDGLLSLSEIYTLKLKTKLVILSACNTATKINEYSNGFDGIVSAFIDAGAQNVIATHWPVEDNASYIMISKTIEKSVKLKISLSESLKRTKIEFINGEYGEDFKHPFYWSPFIIVG
jgi:CHAT domain-containing protein